MKIVKIMNVLQASFMNMNQGVFQGICRCHVIKTNFPDKCDITDNRCPPRYICDTETGKCIGMI